MFRPRLAGSVRAVWSAGVLGIVAAARADVTNTFYVNAANKAGQNPPYTTLATAATNIQFAVDRAQLAYGPGTNCIVLVTNGVYFGNTNGMPNISRSNIVVIAKGITVRSVNGPGVTELRPLVTNKRAVDIQSTAAGAVVSGFKIANASWGYNTEPKNSGGGVRMYAGFVTNCVFTNNAAANRGGGVYMAGGRVADCTFVTNRSTEWQYGRGGAVYASAGTVENCRFERNYTVSYVGGGAVYLDGATALLRNCRIVRNEARRDVYQSAGRGGGIAMTAGRVQHCTVADNFSVYNGGGIYMTGGSVTNSIVYHNAVKASTPEDNANIYKSAGAVGYSCSTPLQPGAGNTNGLPQFVSRSAGNYRLGAGSAAIDRGVAIGLAADLEGVARPIDGDGNGSALADMGCYEAADPTARAYACSFSAPQTRALNQLTTTFAAAVCGPDTNIVYYWWDFNKGGVPAMATNGASLRTVSWTFGPGRYTVSLTVSNASGLTATRDETYYVQVLQDTLYVATNGAARFPYSNWADAARDVQTALDAAYVPWGSNVTVLVSNGTYTIAREIAVAKRLTVRSRGGPWNTYVKTGTSVRGFSVTTNAVISGFKISGMNTATYDGTTYGGGVYMLAGLVTNCAIVGIKSGGQGGGVWMSAGMVVDCLLTNNMVQEWQMGYGGGVYMTGGLVNRCRIYHNTSLSRNGGAGVYMSGGTLRNCLVSTNMSTRTTAGSEGICGGVRITGGRVENCTISGNYSYGTGGGLYQSGGAVTNTIVYFNTTSGGFPVGERNIYKSGGTLGYSCVTPATAGTGNTDLDPDFQYRAGMFGYHLKATSPCINKGTNLYWTTAGSVDLDGSNRLVLARVDMGCYEAPDFSAGPLTCNFSAPVREAFTNLNATFTATVFGGNTNIQYFWWDFQNDGAVDREGPGLWTVTNRYSAGWYNVSLTVSNSAGEKPSKLQGSYIKVAPRYAYVATNGANVAPYMTWSNAATDVQQAVSVGGSSGTTHTVVLVAAGRYNVGTQIQIAKPIRVKGVSGPAATVLRATSSDRVASLTHADATLEGLTLMGCNNSGNLFDGGGVYMTAGTVTNCIVRDNLVGGQGGGIRLSNGLVTDCTFITNRCTEWQYGYGGAIYMVGGLVRNCVFKDNWTDSHQGGGAVYVNGGTLRGCLLYRNRATRTQATYEGDGGGAVVNAGVMESCTLANNWSVKDGGGLQMKTGGAVTNCIVWHNRVTTIGAANIDNPVRIRYSDSPNLTHGVDGNITNAPLFVNTNAANYQLSDLSPCIEKGALRAWMPGAKDLAGGKRVLRQFVDMGAYENQPPYGSLIVVR